MSFIYFDNAATSWPKPAASIEAMIRYNREIGSSPGRSGHQKSIEAGRVLFDTRELIAELFSVQDPLRIVFTSNATHSLNLAILGIIKPNDHVITTSMEHNSVMRPLRYLEEAGVELTVVSCDNMGVLDPEKIENAVKKNTRMIVMTHASNVTGSIMPISDVGKIASKHGIIFCVDAAQTAGSVCIDIKSMSIDILCFTGHKMLFGPMGTGGIYVSKGIDELISPLMYGGTGSRSEFERQPDFMPDKFESGTLNAIGIAGLYEGIRFIQNTGLDIIRRREEELTRKFLAGISEIDGVKIYGTGNVEDKTSVVAFNIDNYSPSETALYFDENYGILSRPGLHCAPSAHKTLGTFPEGTNRFSFSYFNTEAEIEIAVEAVRKLAYQ